MQQHEATPEGRKRVRDLKAEEAARRELINLAQSVRGTARQKTIAAFNDPKVCAAMLSYGNRRQKRAAQRAMALRQKGGQP